jgi:hypothetical protein
MPDMMKIELTINIENELEQRAILDALGGINHRLNVIRDKEKMEFESKKSVEETIICARVNIIHANIYPDHGSDALDAAISDILSAKAKIKEKEKDGITFQL